MYFAFTVLVVWREHVRLRHGALSQEARLLNASVRDERARALNTPESTAKLTHNSACSRCTRLLLVTRWDVPTTQNAVFFSTLIHSTQPAHHSPQIYRDNHGHSGSPEEPP
ncbi:hypothetical protein SCLCIDRAFT_1088113 [Scleroderma citrinum Foug A]|uniref:Uncharacterized protein n=1 Tax=Scleroderma citrinum Foug A TaxID=1036808 RepID=A0A0C3A1S5_9AGAM|nr:hypothetical protein SCLCIDRAFT_1088113 [Scleroderma citrinum Foug A]